MATRDAIKSSLKQLNGGCVPRLVSRLMMMMTMEMVVIMIVIIMMMMLAVVVMAPTQLSIQFH